MNMPGIRCGRQRSRNLQKAGAEPGNGSSQMVIVACDDSGCRQRGDLPIDPLFQQIRMPKRNKFPQRMPVKLNKIAGLLAGTLISASPAIGQVNLFKSEFNTDGDLEGWVDVGDFIKEFLYDGVIYTGEEEVNGGAYRGKAIGDDPKMNKGVSISKDAAKEVVVRLRQSQDNGASWDTAGNLSNGGILLVLGQSGGNPPVVLGCNNLTEFAEVADETVPGDGWTLLTYPLVGQLTTDITSIRFDPSGFSTGESFEVDYIRVIAVDDPPVPVAELNPTSPIDGSLVLDAGVGFVEPGEILEQLGIGIEADAAAEVLLFQGLDTLDDVQHVDRGTAAAGRPCRVLIDARRLKRAVGAGEDGAHGVLG